MTGEKHEVCNECGCSVRLRGGRFINRVPDFNTLEERVTMGKLFPQGDYVCAECDRRRELSSHTELPSLTMDELDIIMFGLDSIACGDATFCGDESTGDYENCTKCSQLRDKLNSIRE